MSTRTRRQAPFAEWVICHDGCMNRTPVRRPRWVLIPDVELTVAGRHALMTMAPWTRGDIYYFQATVAQRLLTAAVRGTEPRVWREEGMK